MDKRNKYFIIIYVLFFILAVGIKYASKNQFIGLNKEFSVDIGQMTSVRTDHITRIKLLSIDTFECETENCDNYNGLSYTLLIDGKQYNITHFFTLVNIDDKYSIEAVDGDEDRVVLKVVSTSE